VTQCARWSADRCAYRCTISSVSHPPIPTREFGGLRRPQSARPVACAAYTGVSMRQSLSGAADACQGPSRGLFAPS